MIVEHGSVRVDLLGGTLDIHPINLILPEVVTINVATSLQAEVRIEETRGDLLKIYSSDYNKQYLYDCEQLAGSDFAEMNLVISLLKALPKVDVKQLMGLTIELRSGAPAGSGLGGSSAMGVTLLKALNRFFNLNLSVKEIFNLVFAVEAKVLACGPTGYQDYYPALYGGILALKADVVDVKIEQHFNKDLANFLQQNITLVYSGQSRFSAINNWEVFKAFFDNDKNIRQGLMQIAQISAKAYRALEQQQYSSFLECIIQEGEVRTKLFKNIATKSMLELVERVRALDPSGGLKVCGAGGGGCFLLIHPNISSMELRSLILESNMEQLPFIINPPIGELSDE